MLSFISGYYPSLSPIEEVQNASQLRRLISEWDAHHEALSYNLDQELEQNPDMELENPDRFSRATSDMSYVQNAILVAEKRIVELENPQRPILMMLNKVGSCADCAQPVGGDYLRSHNYVDEKNRLICESCHEYRQEDDYDDDYDDWGDEW